MKRYFLFLISITAAILTFSVNVKAKEPPEIVSIYQRVRMSTLIVVGSVVQITAFDANSLKTVKDADRLVPGQQALATIKVERVLYSSPSEGIQAGTSPETVDVVIGEPGWVLREPSNATEIFFLTRNVVPQAGAELHHYAFFNWTNLSAPIGEEGTVMRFVRAFDALK
jgi:hypothetical protein